MAVLHLPDNIKIHFAGCEVQNQFIAVEELGIRYGLYTAYPFVERMVFGRNTAPIIPLRWMKDPKIDIPRNIFSKMRHVIQDSGLFTLMFGSMAGKHDGSIINKWYDNLVAFTLQHGLPVTCVEVDCQKVLGVEEAWRFRERMRNDLPNNRIINVFHLEDGLRGLDRLIEFSDYIAISIPELRRFGKKMQAPSLLRYIKKRKPEREGMKETPDRIIRMWRELFRGYDPEQKPKITTFANDMKSTDIVFDTGKYYSMCEHHILPFFGQYYFAYIPKADGRILGISKVARVVGYCAAKMQLQERLAREIVQMLSDALDNEIDGMAIVMKGTHLCKTMRGVKSNGQMTTAYLSGLFRTDADARREFYKLIDINS